MQVARHRPGGVDHHVMITGGGVHDPDRFGLGERRPVLDLEDPVDLSPPVVGGLLDLNAVGGVDLIVTEEIGQLEKGFAGIADQDDADSL